ncbi:hypothetical protein BZA05DRAFT_169384 [Tricharina praecox]|uniref:uncharacterized protein n=1 Tax=Tricharina praecox TaxID=43433 RepID=UPI00222061F4|nr:uncharacterized protein BZA05DRAFT_169384 [Tricharina praecox]KAI5857246.1 hypothetical protein BZA05DRAFT_169384 [Tricharina praecox]
MVLAALRDLLSDEEFSYPIEPSIIIFGTCDTKLLPLLELRSLLSPHHRVLLADVGRTPTLHTLIDIPQSSIIPSGVELSHLPRNELVTLISTHLTTRLSQLYTAGTISAAISLGGSSGTALAATAMRAALPIGFPKLIVTTMASGDVSPYVGDSDITLMPSIVDIAGENHILSQILRNAAGCIGGMAAAAISAANPNPNPRATKRVVAISMFGITTPAVVAAQRALEENGFEVLVLHATGSGGRVLERLVREGRVDGVLDITTTEIADLLCGGVLSAGPQRLMAAATRGVPQIVSVGATDCVNFGPKQTLPEEWKGRTILEHNPTVTLVRTSTDECRRIGRHIGETLRKADAEKGRTEVWCPGRGVSTISEEGGPFQDFEADRALAEELQKSLGDVAFRHFPEVALNDEKWGREMAVRLMEMMGAASI